MTDYTLIKQELLRLLDCSEDEVEQYMPYMENAAASIMSTLKNHEDENDSRIVNLCAVTAYYQIVLSRQDDGIVSFKAGDVSYTRENNQAENAYKLLKAAQKDCAALVNESGFAFKAV